MIDVIIPAYNCRDTIGRTLGSLAAQTDKNFKVTIVDDCSTQLFSDIIEKYRDTLDISVKYNVCNLGCGMSRQVGIDCTSNPYFCFLDSDDMFMPYTVAIFNNAIAMKNPADIYHSHFYNAQDKGVRLFTNGFTWCHGKLYSRELVNTYGIRNSPEVKWADDSFFNSMCIGLGEMRVIELPMYVWVENPDSIMHRKNEYRDTHSVEDFITAMCLAYETVHKHGGNTGSFIPSIKECLAHRKHTKADEELAELVIRKINNKE